MADTGASRTRLHEGRDFTLYRISGAKGGFQVLKLAHDGDRNVDALDQEYALTVSLACPVLRRPLERLQVDGREALRLEYVEGRTLLEVHGENPSLESFLHWSIRLAAALQAVHDLDLQHRNLMAAHVLVDAAGEIRIIGWGHGVSASPRTVLLAEGLPPGVELSHIAPEATGRLARRVDPRADLYSLGVIFYRMLTGRLPFPEGDALELIHAHLAQMPESPSDLDARIPRGLSRVILRLLAKDADDRYQTARGLGRDLEICRELLASSGIPDDFVPALRDRSNRLIAPQRLYGREAELDSLLQAFQRCRGGRTELVLLSGYAGVGKSALVHELRGSVAQAGGWFCEGKYDQFQRHVPYSAWISALGGLVNQLLGLGTLELKALGQRIQEALGGTGGVLLAVIPNLEWVIGPQAEVPELAGVQAQNRFEYAFLGFLRACAASSNGLAIFLDDLHWVDGGSLRLLRSLMADPDLHGVLVLGAYRDNEVDADHPLLGSIAHMEGDKVSAQALSLENLSRVHVGELVADSLRADRASVGDLADALYSKTGGNAFFTHQLLHRLAEKGILTNDPQTLEWSWDSACLAEWDVSSNVIDLMLERIRLLRADSQALLRCASAIGNRFESRLLALACELSLEDTLMGLESARADGLILPVDKGFRFIHDRVQQAAYLLIPEAGRSAFHARIGTLLKDNLSQDEVESRVFEVAGHLNKGLSASRDRESRRICAQFDLAAGRKARASAAYGAAREYLDEGLKALDMHEETFLEPGSGGSEGPDLELELHLERAEACYLCGDYAGMDVSIAFVRAHARNLFDEVRVCVTEIKSRTARSLLLEAIELGVAMLNRLGMPLPLHPSQAEAEACFGRCLTVMKELGETGISSLPVMTDPLMRARMEILDVIGEPAYASAPQFFVVWASVFCETALRHGHSPYSPFGFSAFALALCASGFFINEGYALGTQAVSLIESLHAQASKCRVYNIYGGTIQFWKEPLRNTIPILEEGLASGLETGDHTSGGYCNLALTMNPFFYGEPLPELALRLEKNLRTIRNLKQTFLWNWVAPYLYAAYELAGFEARCQELMPQGLNAWKERAESAHDLGALAHFRISRFMVASFMEQPEEARRLAVQTREAMLGFQGTMCYPVFFYFEGLVQADQGAEGLPGLQADLEQLDRLAELAPCNFAHKRDLLAAEVAALEGRDWRAWELFHASILGAVTNGYVQEAALAYERTARFAKAKGMQAMTPWFLSQARERYSAWGALAKVRLMEAATPSLRQVAGSAVSELDLHSFIKASRAISGEILLPRLLDKMMRIVLESAGAQKGFILSPVGEDWIIEAEGRADRRDVDTRLRPSLGTDADPGLSASVVRFVARTRDVVVLANAELEGAFVDDAHVRRDHVKSLYCAPLMSLAELQGILYLENSLTAGVFTPQRLELIGLLSAQMGAALDNARLYQRAQQEIEVRRQAEERLRVRNVLLATQLEVSPDGILVVDPGGKILSWNRRFVEIWAIPIDVVSSGSDEAALQSVLDKLERPEEFLGKVGHLYSHPEETSRDEINLVDGRILDRYSAPMRSDEGQMYGRIWVFKDITEQRRAEAERRRMDEHMSQVQKLEALGVLVAGIAHNINNVLTAIMATASLREGLDTDPRDQEAYAIIGTACRRGRDVVKSLMQFVRPTISNPVPLDMHALITEVRVLLENISRNRIQIHESFCGEPLWVHGDAGSLNHGLMNLCINAFDAMPNGGTLTLRTLDSSSEWVEVAVEDTGEGMSAETLARVLEPFFTTKPVGKGTGLGLSMTHGVVKAHGGTLDLFSVPGQGTIVKLRLPRIPAPEAKSEILQPVASLDCLKVLLVDDDRDVRFLVGRMLKAAGMKVETSVGGEEALECLRAGATPDIVILDQNMPGMSGTEALVEIRNLKSAVPVLISSGQPDIEDWACFKQPHVAVISKPFDLAELRAKLVQMGVVHTGEPRRLTRDS